jgi:PAS domain S-box-containing protein
MSEEQQKTISETTFTSNGEIGALIRSLDWSQTPLGAAENWSQSLKDTVQILSTELDRAKQQERAAEAAQQNEIETLLLRISNGFYRLDRHWHFTAVNDRFCEIVGMEREAMIGHSLWDLFADTVNTQFDTELHRALNEQTPAHFEYFYQAWNRWYEHWVYPSPEGLIIFGADISDRKQAEAALRLSEERYRLLTSTLTSIVWTATPEGALITPQPEWEAYTGQSWENYQNWGWTQALHPEDRGKVLALWPQATEQRTICDFEGRMWHAASGEYHYFEAQGLPLLNPDGSIREWIGTITDIHDRQQAEAALQESKVRLDFSLEAAQFGDWDLDLRTHKAYRSLKHDQIFGYESLLPEWTYEMFLEHVLPEEREDVDQHYRVALENNEDWNIECRICRADQQVRWIWVLGYVYFNAQGEAIRMVGLVSDITDRKQSEAALRESESQFRLIVDSAKEYAIFTMNLQGYVTKWNSGAERLLGYTEAEAIGCSGEIIFTPEDNERGRAESEIQTALTQGQATNESWHLRKDGSRFWASGLIMPLLDEIGTPQGVVKILQDKTAQRQAVERLQLLHETTRDLLSTDQPLALIQSLFTKLSVQLDLHYYYNFMMEEKDDRLMLHLKNYDGISEAEAQAIEWVEVGQSLCGLTAQERRQIVLDEAHIDTHPNAQVVCAMGVKAYAGQPLIAQGQLLGTLCFASRTRTHFTPAEIELLQSTCDQIAIAIERTNLTNSLQQQAEQLRQANRIKDEFLAVLSHELRSPLNPILGWSKLLQGGKLDPTKTAQALATIERNAKLQAELIEDLLDVSRILQGKLSLNVRSVDLALIIRAAIETVRLAAEAKSIAIEVMLDPEVGQVSGDATRLQQVIWNLLSNAVKFTPMGGRVTVRLEPAGNQAQITVSDTGKGILPDFLPYVFDYFRQEDGATTRKFGGLGLGLAIVHHLVELHGGTVQVASPGEDLGATFTVKLPLMPIQSAVTGDRLSSEPSLDLNGIQVLVIDDETDSREFVAFVLEQAGARVTTATTASEGFALLTQSQLTQSQPQVLLSDVGMPDMDGYMLMRQVRMLPPERGGNVLAIALTAYAGDFNQEQALQAGFQQHLAKPIEPEALVRVIANLTRGIAS